jgi:2-polyprenyl-6-hydroxyphenyl methylase / 3-demethylubiquinone-9 3-methyltransferase
MKPNRKIAFSTINRDEISHFAQDSADWWNLDGPFAPLHRMTPARMMFLKETIGDVKGKSILDIGCGGGLISVPLSRLGAKVTGIDADAQAISIAKNHAKGEGLPINFISGAAEDLVTKGQKYDVVLALEVIEHVENPSLFVDLCAQLVKPNGLVIFSTLNRTWKSYALGIVAAERVLKWVPVGTHDWKKFIKPSELARLAEKNGLFLRNAKGMVFNPFNNKFSIHPHDLDLNYFLVASPSVKR